MERAHEIFDRELMVRRRDRFAAVATEHDFLLERVADDLMQRLAFIRRRFPVAVNLGAYHGVVGRHLRASGVADMVIDVELSKRLVERCARPSVRADEELLPFRAASLDLVVSGLALHLVNDLPGALAQIRRALKPDGLLLAALLGGRTLYELREAFVLAEAEHDSGASPHVAPFADVRDLGGLLQRAQLALPVADSDCIVVHYSDPFTLMHELQAMGASNMLRERRRRPMRRRTLLRAAQIYAERRARPDGRIPATFEIVTATGWAPHENQQQPLQPGSGRRRLADALGTVERPAGQKAQR
jgi:NADH dehydrogenase [ubiquinone] 1 alpha subcomplex assembly factor 5